ncbi:DUF6011 domain-containing protein [Streptomyces sp. DH8]|uniref:DUF6011 domain-containing protein n=1 Tax=Streptomyces sp. DH8 TaxID=2857008 RepID=UPI001E3A0104|nr:DUF6011 domain-containing protein [Streptomyces sp. DH8]
MTPMSTGAWPDLGPLAKGYYAVLDPQDPATMTYWRRVITPKVDGLKPWPAKAWWGPPVPRRADVPADRAARDRFIAAWSESRRTYLTDVVAALVENPTAAGQRFAEWNTRCCQCSRVLHDALSKAYGIGPECRKHLPGDILARYYTPEVARAHAEHVGANPA